MAKHEKTLKAIFAKPTSGTIDWRKIESLFVSLGAEVIEGAGSRVVFILNEIEGHFHRPHPRKETSKGAVESARDFLTQAGFAPVEPEQDEED